MSTVKIYLDPNKVMAFGAFQCLLVMGTVIHGLQLANVFKTQCQDEVRTYSAGTHILKVVKWG